MQFNDYLLKRLSNLQLTQELDNSKKNNIFSSSSLYDASIFSSASAEEVENIDFEKLLSSDEANINDGVTDQNMKSLNTVLKSLFSLEEIQTAADTDGDGKLSVDEASAYIKSVMGKDGDASSLMMSDIDTLMEELGIDLAAAAEESVNEALQDLDVEEIENELKAEEQKQVNEANKAQSASNAGGVSGSGNSNRTANSGANNAEKAAQKNLDTMSLDELKTERETRQADADKAQEELNAVYNGENAAVKSAEEEADKAKEEYEKALANDDQVPEELKTQQETNTKNIEAKEKEIDDNQVNINNKESEINSQEGTVSSLESNLSSLKSSLSSLPSPTGKEEDAENDAAIAEKKASIEQQISAKEQEVSDAKDKLEDQKKELDELNITKNRLAEEKTTLEEEKKTIQAEIEKVCAPETKDLMAKYNEAKANVDAVKSAEAEKAQEKLQTAQAAVKEVDTKITEAENKKVAKENSVNNSKFDFNFDEDLTQYNEQELDKLKEIFEKNKDKYEKVAEETGIPAELICAIHYREGSCNFNTYLHNGDPLGQVTTHVPAGKYFEDWTSAAIDAINSQNPDIVKDGDFDSCCEFAERYNGLGYRNKGLASPYVWAGTTKYTGGMYVADGQFSATAKDKRIGVAVAMKYLMS